MRGRSGTIRKIDARHHRAKLRTLMGDLLRMMQPVERAMEVEVDQRMRIAARPERVWRALVTEADLRRWLFPNAVVDARVGGFWRFTFPHWPSARGLWHPALNFGGPIVELEPGRLLAVDFEPPYWGVLRYELAPDGDGTEHPRHAARLRGQRGLAGRLPRRLELLRRPPRHALRDGGGRGAAPHRRDPRRRAQPAAR